MSWCHFQPGEKKKGSKRQPREAKKESLVTDDLEQDVDECVTEMFSQASQELMKFLTNSQGNQQEIRTAVVCCSFPHVDIFRKALGTGLKTTIFPINKDSQVRNVIETARQSKLAGVFLIEQIESLSSEFIENLLYLSQWFELQHSFVICTSTGVSSFSDICSFDTLKSINAEIFNMPRPEDIYTQVIKCLLKKCQADRIHLSGEVLSLLRSRYFCNSFSVEEMKKTIRICVKHHNWQVDQSKSVPNRKDFEALVEGYWRNLEYYTTTVNADLFKCHEEIQTGTFKAPKQMSAIAVSEWIELDSVPAEIRKEVKTHLVSYFQRKADDSAKESEMDTSTNVTASSKQRFTNTELKKQLEQQRTAMLAKKQSRPELLLEHACKTIVDKLLCSWKNFPQSDQFLIRDEPKKVLYCDPAALVENALLLETNKNEPLSAAFRGLQQRSNWKSTKISGWLKNYESEYVTSNKENTTPSFYAALGQLESMGVVKASFERSKDSVTVLHHPISHVLN